MTSRPLLLDTCAAVWLIEGVEVRPGAEAAFGEAQRSGAGVYVSPISAWEVGILVAKGRLAMTRSPLDWFETLVDTGVQVAELTPPILVASSFLPGQMHGDPADRILAATARARGFQLMTRDSKLLRYAEAGHIRAIAC